MFVRTAPAICPREVLPEKEVRSVSFQTPKTKVSASYLAIVASEIQVMQGMVCWAVDDIDERVTSDHIRIVDLKTEVGLAL